MSDQTQVNTAAFNEPKTPTQAIAWLYFAAEIYESRRGDGDGAAHALRAAARIIHEQKDKARRFKGWRVVWFVPADGGGEWERRDPATGPREAHTRKRHLLQFKVATRARVVRVYRKAKL